MSNQNLNDRYKKYAESANRRLKKLNPIFAEFTQSQRYNLLSTLFGFQSYYELIHQHTEQFFEILEKNPSGIIHKTTTNLINTFPSIYKNWGEAFHHAQILLLGNQILPSISIQSIIKNPPITDEEKIIHIFYQNVYGKTANIQGANPRHAGSRGHWLETQMGLTPNGNNAPDLYGYEMKNATTSKTTFGDWSANYYIFKDPNIPSPLNPLGSFTRQDFFNAFGKPNALKNNRISWSGEPVPKINQTNTYGCTLAITADNSLVITYSYQYDQRPNKAALIPLALQTGVIILAKWDAISLKNKVESKFNQNGWFKCETDANGVYREIVFGAPLNYMNWLNLVLSGDVFFDSGMYETNNRPYSMWRANNNLWQSLIVRRYN
jgi:hypothetical protein